MNADPTLDLVLERVVPVPADALWRGWTEPDLFLQWFTPAPWRTTDCTLDLRPGGAFRTVMEGPAGERFDNTGCWLEVVPQRRLVWTSCLGPGFRPLTPEAMHPFGFTGVVEFLPDAQGTRYRAMARHATAAEARTHADMGFEAGWGAALDQLVALMRRA